MPSFISKVFGRKKEDAKEKPLTSRNSHQSLLEGKFEDVRRTPSPIVTTGEASPREGSFGLFRTKSRSAVKSPTSPVPRLAELPTLSLNLPGQREENNSRSLGVVFEGDRDVVLDDSVIGLKRLNPAETIALVKACSQVITERGLETLGIMHPHWHSASPEIQRRLISLFIRSLSPQKSTSTPFETELKFTRSPHDVAAVLRWGLRHLQLDGTSFGKEPAEWAWYQTFSQEERAAEYPPKAFTTKLTPLLPKPHLDLLMATLEIESSLAAHAEHNSISGSKMSKFLGLWLLTASRAEADDDWESFYARWERAGRILEHLFLARIRDESVNHRMPMRLTELVNQYPYSRTSISVEQDDMLPSPRFTTRSYDALFVRIDTELETAEVEKPKSNRLRLIAHAFKLDVAESGDVAQAWDTIKKAAVETISAEDGQPAVETLALNRVFSDETIRLLSGIPTDGSEPAVSLISPSIARSATTRRRSSSLSGVPMSKGPGSSTSRGSVNFLPKAANVPLPESPVMDWAAFSSAGFGEPSSVGAKLSATLLDQDIETTKPFTSIGRRMSRSKRNASRRSSLDSPNPTTPIIPPMTDAEILAVSRTSLVNIIQLDEAFIDFWSDAALDPISAPWPSFVICKLNNIPGVHVTDGKPIGWLVIEQTHSIKPVPRTPSPVSTENRVSLPGTPRLGSRADLSRMSSTLSATRKRFSFFGGSTSGKGDKNKNQRKASAQKSPRISEMGEVKSEVDEPTPGIGATDIVAGAVAAVVGVGAVTVGAVVAAVASPEQQEATPASPIHDTPVPGSAAASVQGASAINLAPAKPKDSAEVAATEDQKVVEDAAPDVVDTVTAKGVDAADFAGALGPAAVTEDAAAIPITVKEVDVQEPAATSDVVDTATAKGVDAVEFAAAVGPAAATNDAEEVDVQEPAATVAPANAHIENEDVVDTATAKDIDASEFAAAVGPAAVLEEHPEADSAPVTAATSAFETQTSEPENATVAPEAVLASGETPGPQQILDAPESAAPHTETQEAIAAPEAELFVPVEDAVGPETAMDTEPATLEPLKDQEEEESGAAAHEEPSSEAHAASEAEPAFELPAVPIALAPTEDVAAESIEPFTEPEAAHVETASVAVPEAEAVHDTTTDADE